VAIDPVVLASYDRSGFVEGVHLGHAVVLDPGGEVARAWGDPGLELMARSSAKPMQATAMVRLGLDLPDDLCALAASSHSGEAMHRDGVLRILAGAGLTAGALQTPADLPLDPVARDAWVQGGHRATPLAMNCSGKHAAMLATCVVQGWSVGDYRDPEHPLQQAILAEVRRLTGDPITRVGVDGCGAPVHVMTLSGLARSLTHAVTAPADAPERRVVDAMRAHPQLVGGSRRDVTELMQAVPGLVAKDGAEGVFVGALADGRSFAVKVLDGSGRARQVAVAAIVQWLDPPGADHRRLSALASIATLGGGRPVGAVRSPLASAPAGPA
jgi:L-asparaginase II